MSTPHSSTDSATPECVQCYAEYSPLRAAAGYRTCLVCGEVEAQARRFTIAPMHKSNYMLITNADDLRGINNKGGLHR